MAVEKGNARQKLNNSYIEEIANNDESLLSVGNFSSVEQTAMFSASPKIIGGLDLWRRVVVLVLFSIFMHISGPVYGMTGHSSESSVSKETSIPRATQGEDSKRHTQTANHLEICWDCFIFVPSTSTFNCHHLVRRSLPFQKLLPSSLLLSPPYKPPKPAV